MSAGVSSCHLFGGLFRGVTRSLRVGINIPAQVNMNHEFIGWLRGNFLLLSIRESLVSDALSKTNSEFALKKPFNQKKSNDRHPITFFKGANSVNFIFFVVSVTVTVVGITEIIITTKIVHYYNGESSQNLTKHLLLV